MADTSVVFNILAKDNASSVFGKVGRSMATIAGGIISGQAVMGGLSKAFSFAKGAAIDFNSQLQNSQIAFTTMLGSGKQAQSFLNQLQSFAKTTPFEFGDLVKNAQNMMGMGIAAKDVIPDLRALGDSVASIGGSAEQVNSVTLAFDQMTAKGTLDMGNMNQLMQNGVPSALKILADSYHVTTGQMIKMISTGKVQSSQALPLLVAGLEKGTKSSAALGGMMDKQSQTFTGALSNISDALTQAMAGAFRPFFDLASKGAQALANMLSSSAFSNFAGKISAAIGNVIGIFQYFVGFITGKGSDGIDNFSNKAFNRVDNMAVMVDKAFHLIKTAIGNVVGFITKTVIPVAKDLWKTFGPLLIAGIGIGITAFSKLTGILKPLGGVLRAAFGFIADHKTTFQAIAVGILAIVGAVKAWTIATQVWSAVTKVATAVQWLLNVAMDANPIGLIILAIVGLAAAFIYLWTHSAAFRNFWIATWDVIKTAALWVWNNALKPMFHLWVLEWKLVAAAVMWVWHNVLEPIGKWFAGPFVNFFKSAWKWIKDHFTAGVNWIRTKMDAVIGFVKGLPSRITNAARGMWDGIKNAFRAAINWLIDKWNGLSFSVPSISVFGHKIGGFTLSTPNIPRLYTGGDITRAGIATVGEKGPETVMLPAGARVLPHGATAAPPIHIHLHGSARALMQDIAAEVRGNFGGNVTVALGGYS